MVYQQHTRRSPLAVVVQHLPEGQTRRSPTRRYHLLRSRLKYKTEHWPELNQSALETLWITTRPHKMARTLSTSYNRDYIYHPPGSNDLAMLNHIDQSLDYIRRHHLNTGIVITGDFNKMKYSHLKQIITWNKLLTYQQDAMQYWITSTSRYPTSINALSLVHQSASQIIKWLSASHPHHRTIQHRWCPARTPSRSHKPRDRAYVVAAPRTI